MTRVSEHYLQPSAYIITENNVEAQKESSTCRQIILRNSKSIPCKRSPSLLLVSHPRFVRILPHPSQQENSLSLKCRGLLVDLKQGLATSKDDFVPSICTSLVHIRAMVCHLGHISRFATCRNKTRRRNRFCLYHQYPR